MGLDQYADGLNKEFYWRKHARLQVFMAREYEKQNPKETKASINQSDLGHLGFNSDSNPEYVKITNEILDRLEEAIKTEYYKYFASDGYFWGQQYQEYSTTEYKNRDKQFLKAARKALADGREVTYSCSW